MNALYFIWALFLTIIGFLGKAGLFFLMVYGAIYVWRRLPK